MPALLIEAALVLLGGALGGMARVWVSTRVAHGHGVVFPWGTLVVNVSGAACIGVLAGLLGVGTEPPPGGIAWAGLVAGLLGSYTTVSSFSLQTLALFRQGEPLRALANVAASLLLCLAAAGTAFALTSAAWAG